MLTALMNKKLKVDLIFDIENCGSPDRTGNLELDEVHLQTIIHILQKIARMPAFGNLSAISGPIF